MKFRHPIQKIILGISGVVILTISIVLISDWMLMTRIDLRITEMIKSDREHPAISHTNTSLQLPAPVARLRSILADDQRPVRGVKMSLTGRIKLPGSDSWNEIEGRQYVSAVQPKFLWNVRMQVGPGWVEIEDAYQDGSGGILSRAFSILPLLNEKNIPELSITQLVRWSGLLTMISPALIDNPNITWTAIDGQSALATVKDGNISAEHIFFFDEQGRVTATESSDRYELYKGKGYQATESLMHRVNYKTIDGIPIPTSSKIIRIENGKPIEFLNEEFYDIVIVR